LRRSDAEEKTFLENHEKKVIEERVAPSFKKSLDEYDNIIFDILGKKKNGEKTTDFIRSEFTDLKSKVTKVAELENEIAELKKGKPDDAKLQEIRDLQKEIMTIKSQHETELSNFAKTTQKSLIKSDIERGLLDLKIKAGIPDSVKQVYVDRIIDELASGAEMRDNQIVFLDADKKALRNPATMAPYTAKELLTEKMKDLIETSHQQRGPVLPRGEQPVVKGADGKLKVNITLPGNITTRTQWGEYLIKEMGLKTTTPEYREAYKLGAELPVVEVK